jgi:DMSO/TMAO reductase YedYZ heme-binding membrane subunit
MRGLPSQFWWWVARATGIVAWATATAAVAWGITLSGRLVRRRRLPAWLLDLHRYLGTLTLAFLAVHVVALVADGYVDFGAREILVPMASAWRPGAVTWGVLAMYGLAVVQVTSWSMKRLPRKAWHGIHCTSYAVFVAATVHGALSGADRANPLAQGLAVAGVTLVVVLTALRVLGSRNEVAAVGTLPRAGREVDPGATHATADGRAAKIAAARARVAATRALAELPPPAAADRLAPPEPVTPTSSSPAATATPSEPVSAILAP